MKTWATVTITVSVCITIIVACICFAIFAIETLHESSRKGMDSLGLLGDFVGGTVGTVAAIISVVATIFIAVKVNQFQAKLAKSSMDHSLGLIRYQRRQQAFLSFMDTCDKVIRDILKELDYEAARYDLHLVLEASDRISLQFKELEGNGSLLHALSKNCFVLSKLFKELPPDIAAQSRLMGSITWTYRKAIDDLNNWVETGTVVWSAIDQKNMQEEIRRTMTMLYPESGFARLV